MSVSNMGFQWPVKILLVHPKAPFLQKEKLVIAADCSVLLNRGLGEKFGKGETVIIGCPLLEDPDRTFSKLRLVFKETNAKKVEVYTMEVPCCHALHYMALKASSEAERGDIEVKNYIVRVEGGRIEEFKPGVVDESMIEAERKAHRGA